MNDIHVIVLEESIRVRRAEISGKYGNIGVYQKYIGDLKFVGDVIFKSHESVLNNSKLSSYASAYVESMIYNTECRHAFTVDTFNSMINDIDYITEQLELYKTQSIDYQPIVIVDYIIPPGTTVVIVDNQVLFRLKAAHQVASTPFELYKETML